MFIDFTKRVAICLVVIIVVAGALSIIDDSFSDQALAAQVMDEMVAQAKAEHKQRDHDLKALQIEANYVLGMK